MPSLGLATRLKVAPFTEIELNGSNKTDGKIVISSVLNNLFEMHDITQVAILDRHLGIKGLSKKSKLKITSNHVSLSGLFKAMGLDEIILSEGIVKDDGPRLGVRKL